MFWLCGGGWDRGIWLSYRAGSNSFNTVVLFRRVALVVGERELKY
jgi:hypothetical protein